jgi:hypothetical protein
MSDSNVPSELIQIRHANEADAETIWNIFREVVEEGDAFVSDDFTPREDALAMWLGPDIATYVACLNDGRIAGAYGLRRNHHGRGSHVANATYMGRGIGRLLGEHSLTDGCKSKEPSYR